MSRTLNVKVDASRVSMVSALRAVAHAGAPLALTARVFGDLAAELGSAEAAAGFLADLAEEVGKPVAVNFATGEDTSSTVFVPPAGWSSERLQGWVAGRHEELEHEFGPVTRVGPNRAERRRRREGRR